MKNKAFIFLVPILILYLNINAHALDPLRVQINTSLPEGIKTIGAAAQHYADVAGYKIKISYPAPKEASQIAFQEFNTLTLVAGIKPIDEAILGLLNDGQVLIIDHENKLISFDKRDQIEQN